MSTAVTDVIVDRGEAPVIRSDGTKQVFRNPARPRRVWGRFDQQIRHGVGGAFFELGLMQNAGFLRRSVECGPRAGRWFRRDAGRRDEGFSRRRRSARAR